MSGWDNSDRQDRLPGNWWAIRARVRRRAGGRCEWLGDGGRCARIGTECDHIVPGDDHSPGNLQWLCAEHHLLKTISERPKRPPRRRKAVAHPGLSGTT